MILIVIMLGLIAGTAYMVKLCLELPDIPVETLPQESIRLPDPTEKEEEEAEEEEWLTQPTETEPPQPAVATVSAQGDLLIHGGIIKTSAVSEGYDFSAKFRYLAPYLEGYD